MSIPLRYPQSAMSILRQGPARAAFDINNPSRAGILRAIEYLAEGDHMNVQENMGRRMEWVGRIRD